LGSQMSQCRPARMGTPSSRTRVLTHVPATWGHQEWFAIHGVPTETAGIWHGRFPLARRPLACTSHLLWGRVRC
jgi:hypothetical protein